MAALRLPLACKATRSHNVPTLHQNGRRRPNVVATAGLPAGDLPPPSPQLSRRELQAAVLATMLAVQPSSAHALGFKKELKKRKIDPSEYSELAPEPRLRYYELTPGSGAEAKEGDRVVVHFDCMYLGLNVVSSRSARTLGGNRTVAEPFEFTVGQPVSRQPGKLVDNAGGLYTGAGGPTPPQALSLAVVGMRQGGKRSLLVPAELGYGSKGEQEIPPDCPTFELRVELLNVA